MAHPNTPSPKITPKDNPDRRSAAETEALKKTSPFNEKRADPRFVCRSGRYPNGGKARGVRKPSRPPAPTTPIRPWPPFRYQADREAGQIAA
ncbi:hypothetical protein ACIRPK_20695 [Kitasatospora sp. NPDC101801]|uniref:hypothetical protein n=1 Tax=Kitasatospora sp. NPDC101801 TaxID=3364103 RepID=UPI003810DF10